jgi:hypothetical protein
MKTITHTNKIYVIAPMSSAEVTHRNTHTTIQKTYKMYEKNIIFVMDGESN